QSGFSLIELMIVVAIIGILASIAVPNFKKFQVKARQSEAKAQLTSLYTAEKAFYGEWAGYTADFRDIGYAPEGRMRYHIGQAAGGYVPAAPFQPSNLGGAGLSTVVSTVQALAAGQAAGFNFTQDAATIGAYGLAAAGTVLGCTTAANAPTQIAFTAGAVGRMASIGGDRDDQWTINNLKSICNTSPGI
ncbi:MAG: prepilin-type N-terminal cleavage/methylation domain-containing protein, partial [Proteobacteria bacterium]